MRVSKWDNDAGFYEGVYMDGSNLAAVYSVCHDVQTVIVFIDFRWKVLISACQIDVSTVFIYTSYE